MTQFRSRDDQVASIHEATAKQVCSRRTDYPADVYRAYLEAQIKEAEARGAAEARRVDGERHRVFYIRSDTLRFSSFPCIDVVLWKTPVRDGGDFTALHTRPANVAALEARVKVLEGAASDVLAHEASWKDLLDKIPHDAEGYISHEQVAFGRDMALLRAALTREGEV